MASTAESAGRLVEEVSLIDILYKDKYRVDSYLAQIMKGLLRRHKIQETESQSDTKNFGGNIKIFTGNLSEVSTSSTTEEKLFIPHDRAVNDLLEMLDLEPQEVLSDEEVVGRLVCLKGRLAVRDFRKFTEVASAMAANNKLFQIDKKEATERQKMFDSLSKIIPMNVEAEVVLKDNSVVRGILKEKYLLTVYQDIIATYGTQLPGMWFTVGILDSLNKLGQPKLPQGFRKTMDEVSAVAETLYREGNPKYTITPVLIFRGLEE